MERRGDPKDNDTAVIVSLLIVFILFYLVYCLK